MVRLAGVEPATLGLEVLRAAGRQRVCFQILRSSTVARRGCIKVRRIVRRCNWLVTLSVTQEESQGRPMENWLPVVDTFRTLCLAAPPEIKRLFENLQSLPQAG